MMTASVWRFCARTLSRLAHASKQHNLRQRHFSVHQNAHPNHKRMKAFVQYTMATVHVCFMPRHGHLWIRFPTTPLIYRFDPCGIILSKMMRPFPSLSRLFSSPHFPLHVSRCPPVTRPPPHPAHSPWEMVRGNKMANEI